MKFITKHSLIWMIIIFIFLSSFNISVSSEEYISSDLENFSFKQELSIPIDTSLEKAKFQPIDIRLKFSNPCWTKDENHHSVRVGVDDGTGVIEIESQIYDLEYSDDSHIKSCSLVFLIPEKADGDEIYYVFYESLETDASDYDDHIILEDTHYFYEPISGQKLDFDYYKITEDGYVIYGIISKGEIIGNPVSQNIARLTKDATIFETYTIDQLASFDLRYGVKGEPDYTGPSAATKVTKNVLVDGNLMVRIRMESISPKGDVKTDNIYTYYFCPTGTKRVFVNVNHDVIKEVKIQDPEVLDGAYAGIITIKSRSTTIEKMNVGKLLPSIHVYDEDETIKEYLVPQDPETVEKELILSTQDDIDLGSKGWVSLDDTSTGKVHGLIMHSNVGLIEKEDGVQIKAYVKQNIKLPGIEGDTGSVFLGKNTYEKGGTQTTVLPQGFHINFDIGFLSDETGGYELIDSESEVIQTLLKSIPIKRENVTDEEEEKEKYTLTTFIHFAPSAPMGSLLSAALGKNIPYIFVELYKENDFTSSGTAGRLPMGAIDLDLEGKKLIQILRTVIGMFDWKNASFFKKIKFSDLEPGTYVVKVFRDNRFFGKERKYIGFIIVELNKNKQVRVFCRPEGSIKLTVKDQNKMGLENVKFTLNSKDVPISDTMSDKNGSASLTAPCFLLKPYKLKVLYQGFLVKEKKITLGFRNTIIKVRESFSVKHHKLNLRIKDTWGFAPEVDVNPTVTSNEMVEPTIISGEKIKDGDYTFTTLYPAKYSLNMGYKSFEMEKDVSIDNDQTLDLIFLAEFELNFDIMNSFGFILNEGEVTVSRKGKSESGSIDDDGKAKLLVPPGRYSITVYSDEDVIAKQDIDVRGNKEVTILSSVESQLHTIIIYLGIALAIFSILFMVWKKKLSPGINLFIIALLIIALVSPWWVLNGDDGTTSTTTKTLLYPPKIISFSSSSEVIGGDVSHVPEEVTMILTLLSMLIVLSGLIIFITVFSKNKFRKTTAGLSILSIIFLIITFAIFIYAMSMLTEVGVGSFIGNGDIDTSLPGISISQVLPSNWGPGIGFYLGFVSIIILVASLIYGRIKNRKSSDK